MNKRSVVVKSFELINKMSTPQEAIAMKTHTTEFLCPMSANTYNIKFCKYKIRDMQSGVTLVDLEND